VTASARRSRLSNRGNFYTVGSGMHPSIAEADTRTGSWPGFTSRLGCHNEERQHRSLRHRTPR